MAESSPTAPPILSTPDTHLFEDPSPPQNASASSRQRPGDNELNDIYEIDRTVREIHQGGWRRVALQFDDGMLPDAVRVFENLEAKLNLSPAPSSLSKTDAEQDTEQKHGIIGEDGRNVKENISLCILADTTYGSCCVDEIAAQHVDAQVVVHYGRSCLSPPARLPVIYVFTKQPVDKEAVIAAFETEFGTDKSRPVILMSDGIFI